MNFRKSTNKLTAWLAILAMLMLSLAPSISSALDNERDASGFWGEICTSVGSKFVRNDQNADPAKPVGKHLNLEHCAYCAMHADHALPPAPASAVALTLPVSSAPKLFYLAPTPLFAWSAAQPRAPPLFS